MDDAVIEPGTIIAEKYRLEAEVGQGGMATVWRAVHTTLDRPVAVKFLEAIGVDAQQLAARFVNEAKLAAGLRHRHVVDIMDVGVHAGVPFMIMELLEGSSLADRYSNGPPVSDWELMEIVAMTLSGLAAVHDAGILHRDVKPENIFLVEDADGMYPKLLDFGVSRGMDAQRRITKTGAIVGTPQYMSPEQARGKRDIDHRSDLFSVGIVLYEGLAGDVPFDSENIGDIMISIATEPHAPLEELRPDLPRAVLDLVDRALSKPPEDRFADARSMREALLDVLQGADPMSGRPSQTTVRTAYTSSNGTGKLRVLSRPPSMPDEPPRDDPSIQIALVTPKLPAEARELTTARLPPPRPAKSSSRRWLLPLVGALVLALAAGAFVAFDGMRYIGATRPAEGVGRGAVRPGEAVASTIASADGEDEVPQAHIEPPPTEGLPAPLAETVDVPSPPDPPAAPELE